MNSNLDKIITATLNKKFNSQREMLMDFASVLFCENISRIDAKQGWHMPVDCNTYLIQISDIGYGQPIALYKDKFSEIIQLNFNDTEDESDSQSISDYQAKEISNFLLKAKQNKANIVVHCHAGICRSGAVVESAMSIGYADVEQRLRLPNSLVKRKIMQELGTYITPKTSMFGEDFFKDEY